MAQFPIETKVKAATYTAGGSAVVTPAAIYALLSVVWPNMSQTTQVVITAVVSGALTAAGTFYAGYKAKHTSRPTAPPA